MRKISEEEMEHVFGGFARPGEVEVDVVIRTKGKPGRPSHYVCGYYEPVAVLAQDAGKICGVAPETITLYYPDGVVLSKGSFIDNHIISGSLIYADF